MKDAQPMALTTLTTLPPDKRKTLTPDAKLGTDGMSSSSGFLDKIDAKYGSLIPQNLSAAERERALVGIAVGVYVNRLDGDELQQRILKTRDALLVQRGDLTDEKADRLATLGFAREMKAAALERDPLTSISGQERQMYVAAASYARREMGWSNQAIREAAVDLIVRMDGDQAAAAKAFGEMVKADRRVEPGHMKNESVDKSTSPGDDEKAVMQIAAPAADPEAMAERLAREKAADAKLVGIDKTAAAVLSDKEYAAYRLIRDNAETISLDRRGQTLDGDATDNTAAKLISDQLAVSLRQGRQYAETVMEKLQRVQEPGGQAWGVQMDASKGAGDLIQKLGDLSTKVAIRTGQSTAEIVMQQRNSVDAGALEDRRARERQATRERAARLYAAKKSLLQEQGRAAGPVKNMPARAGMEL